MERTDVLVVGGGQAGLAAAYCLRTRGIDHLVLERGRVGERWRSERWASLRLLTPRWQSRLPGFAYTGAEPHGYMTAVEVAEYLEAYARSFTANVRTGTALLSLEPADGGYLAVTSRGFVKARSVVIATGACDRPYVPPVSRRLSPLVNQVVPTAYRRPSDLPAGGVLVVGASATGVQLAEELSRSGRQVTLSVGRHTRLPRRYLGRDILAWMDAAGVLAERAADLPPSARDMPSLQLVGSDPPREVDLPALVAAGVHLTGRLVDVDGPIAQLGADLAENVAVAERRLHRLLDRIDAFAGARGDRPSVFRPPQTPGRLDLRAEGITTVLWATGFHRRYPWLRVPVLDGRGELRHVEGVTPSPGLYVLGLPLLRRRASTFLDGVGDDARTIADRVATYLRRAAA